MVAGRTKAVGRAQNALRGLENRVERFPPVQTTHLAVLQVFKAHTGFEPVPPP
jgi:hypothetical protein